MKFFSISWPMYQSIIFVWMGVALCIFFLLLKITAPYGRHSSGKWGPQVLNITGWLLMELPVLAILWLNILPAIHKISAAAW